jgi:hypothetical protein
MDYFSHPPQCPDVAPHDFHLFGALKDAMHVKTFGSHTQVTEQVAAKYKIQTSTRREQMLLFLTGTRLLKFMEIMQRNEVCNKNI